MNKEKFMMFEIKSSRNENNNCFEIKQLLHF